MKKLFLLLTTVGLFFSMTSFENFDEKQSDEANGICWLTITTTNPQTGAQTTETYYSTQRTSEADCRAGVNAFLAGNFMKSSDFRRSPVLAP